MNAKYILNLILYLFISACAVNISAFAQTDIHISGAKSGFPIAVPRLCALDGGAGDSAQAIPERVSKNLEFTDLFVVINPGSFVESPGKCGEMQDAEFGDWSIIGAEFLVKGKLEPVGDQYRLEVRLFNVPEKRAVLGKQYTFQAADSKRVSDRFSNEIIKYFTGKKGIFGTQIAYVSKIGRFKELFVMDFDGSSPRQLTRDKGLAITPSWSPDSRSIAYTSYKTRRPELYVVSASGGGAKRISNREGNELGPEYLKSGGGFVVAASTNGISNIVEMDFSGRIVRSLTREQSIAVSPSLSPDGSMLAFCSNRSGGPQIYTMPTSGPTSGGGGSRISFTNSNYCTSPAWSPEGDKVAFVCRAGGNQLFVSAPDGSDVRQLTYSGNNEDPSWSPDGSFLVFSSDFGGGARNVAVMPLASGKMRQITFSKSDDGQPSWSGYLE